MVIWEWLKSTVIVYLKNNMKFEDITFIPRSEHYDIRHNHIPIDVFCSYCETGAFIDDDGYGVIALEDSYSTDLIVKPSLCKGKLTGLIASIDGDPITYPDILNKITHVIWYNR